MYDLCIEFYYICMEKKILLLWIICEELSDITLQNNNFQLLVITKQFLIIL